MIYADGAGADGASAADLDLSHWVPNGTPERYKADTSTEICLRYVADPGAETFDLVVNDHIDVDGVLSVFTIVNPGLALANAPQLIGAAEMGDFLGYADRRAFALYQELAILLADPASASDIGERYAEALDLVTAHLTGSRAEAAAVADGWATIERGCRQLDDGTITVRAGGSRLVSFVYPKPTDGQVDVALRIPRLNQVVDDAVLHWPQCRNRDHSQAMQLVSIPTPGGWFHELWAPGYCWAETPSRHILPGLVSTGDSNRWIVDHPPLQTAIDVLNKIETTDSSWIAASELTPFTTVEGRRFPVIVSLTKGHHHRPASGLDPIDVAETLAPVWDETTAH